MLVNNGSRYLAGPDLLSATDADVVDTIAFGATGTALTTKSVRWPCRSVRACP